MVVWEWEWTTVEDIDSNSSDSEEESREQHNPYLQSDTEHSDSDALNVPDSLPTQTHTVTFKCIGSVHDVNKQLLLSNISKLLRDNKTVEVRVLPEPDNKFDAKAICFQCYHDHKWQTIGYIVRECLDHVHKALEQKRILSVKVAWAKYLMCWSRSGPGFHAGINISLNGVWHRDVVQSQSTR